MLILIRNKKLGGYFMKKIIIFIVIFLVNLSAFTITMFRTPEAGRFYYWLFSPDLLGRSMGVGGTDNPSGVIINPASNAFVQRFRIDVSYGLTPAFWTGGKEGFWGAEDFFIPFIINAGVIIPSKYGNFTIYANYMNMSNLAFKKDYGYGGNNNDLGIGKIGTVYFSFSKDYSEHFAFGFDGNLKISYNPLGDKTKFDVGGSLDFGLVFRPEWYVPFSKQTKTNWALQDFEFGFTAKELGKFLFNFNSYTNNKEEILPWFPLPFTVSAGLSFNFYNDGATYWKFLTDLSSPFFQNVTLAVGTEIQIYKFFVLRGSYTFDLEGVLEYSGVLPQYEYLYNLANLGFGMSFRFRSDFFKKQTKEEEYKNRHKTTEFSIDLGARPYYQGFIIEAGCAITLGVKDTTPPQINYIQKEYYISPNFDGKQDEVIFDLNIKDDRYVMMWKLEIYNEKGDVVRTIASKEQRKETMKFKDIMRKAFSPKSGIPIPKQIVWDGKDNTGNIVPDGKYSFKFFAMDDNKNINKEGTTPGTVIVDAEKPEITEQITNTIFSPNGDGSKDLLIIDIDIIKNKVGNIIIEENYSPEKFNIKEEKIDLKNIYKEIKEVKIPQTINEEVKSDKPKEQIWYVDIVDATEKVVKSYTYKEKGKKKIEWDGSDEKGNKMPDGVYKIKLHSVDLAGNYWEKFISNIIINTEPTPIEATTLLGVFSPNGDGVKDNIGFRFNVPIKNGTEKWTFEIFNKNKQMVKSFTGEGLPPQEISWNGKDLADNYAKEGDYQGKLTVIYENGNIPYGETPEFTIDVTPPSGTVKFAQDIFSPNNDGKTDDVSLNTTSSYEDEWTGFILNEKGEKIKSYLWRGNSPKQFIWDGKDNANKLLPDGKYFFQLASTDTAGNPFESQKTEVKIFTEDTPVFVTTQLEAFSPNGDKVKDTQTFEIKTKLSKDNKVVNWELTIKDEKDFDVYSIKKDGDLPQTIEWDGKDNNKQNLSDGYYTASLKVNFSATDASSKTKSFIIDTTPPKIDVASTSPVFSPNSDGNLDNFEILQKGSNEDLWEAQIVNNENTVLWEGFYNGTPKEKELWNGKDLGGNIQKNGMYKYQIKSTDLAGNTIKADLNIELKNVYTKAFITLDDERFSPNKDGKFDSLKFRPFVNVKDDLDVYKIEILDKDKKVVKTYQGTKTIPEMIEWDGLTNDNTISKDDFYTIKLSTIYRFGNRPQIESTQFILDTTPPEMKISYNPEFFSPDNDGVDDELEIGIDSQDLSGIKNWDISILSPDKKKKFYSFTGIGKPTAKIVWNGLGNNGELVDSAEDYPTKVICEDNVGNVLEKNLSDILVDILVIKLDDGRLKIKINNIEFKAESAEMTDSPKNEKIINLVAKALKKYSQYRILIEGHANKFKEGLDEKRAKILSDDRAKFILNILTKKGIGANRMSGLGRGFDVPLVPLAEGVTLEDLAKNRRVEFYLDKNQ